MPFSKTTCFIGSWPLDLIPCPNSAIPMDRESSWKRKLGTKEELVRRQLSLSLSLYIYMYVYIDISIRMHMQNISMYTHVYIYIHTHLSRCVSF